MCVHVCARKSVGASKVLGFASLNKSQQREGDKIRRHTGLFLKIGNFKPFKRLHVGFYSFFFSFFLLSHLLLFKGSTHWFPLGSDVKIGFVQHVWSSSCLGHHK